MTHPTRSLLLCFALFAPGAMFAQQAPSTAARGPESSVEKIQLAEDLGNSYESSETPKLVKLLSDADPKVRAAAAKGLGTLNKVANGPLDERERDVDDSIPPLLKAFTDGSPEVRAAAAAAVGDIRARESGNEDLAPEVSSKLAGLLKDSDSVVVAAAARALGQVRDPTAVSALLPLTNHEEGAVKFNAVWALSRMQDSSVTCPLVSLLKDQDKQVRTQAAQGLAGRFGDGQRCPGDVEALTAVEGDPDVRQPVLEALSRLKDARAVKPLLHEIESYTARSSCPECPVLGKIGDKRAVAPLVKLVQDRKGDVGPEVVDALGELRDPTAIPVITPLLKDSRPAMRVAVIRALIDLNGCPSMDLVRPAMTDEIADVRAAAADAAAKCKDVQSVEPLIQMLQFDLAPAAKALGEIGDKRAVDPLIACFQQKQLWGRRFVAHALGQLHDPKVVDLLIAALHDDTTTSEPIWVGIEAAWALAEIGDPRAIAPLQEVVGENPSVGGSQVADAAAAALKKMGAPVPARKGQL
jgi:HEAT repeat protein